MNDKEKRAWAYDGCVDHQHINTDVTRFKREPLPWRNVRRNGRLELESPGSMPDRMEEYGPEDDRPFNYQYTPPRPDKQKEVGYRNGLRKREKELDLWKPAKETPDNPNHHEQTPREEEIKASPEFEAWQAEMIRRHRLFTLSALSMADPRSKDFFNIYKVNNDYGFPSRRWNVYPDQITTRISETLRLDQIRVEYAYRILSAMPENQALLKTPPNCPYEPWHWWLVKLRAPIAKVTGLDSRAVDRALCRMAKKDIKQWIRNSNVHAQDFFSVDAWREDLLVAEEYRTAGTRIKSEMWWMGCIIRSSPTPVVYRFRPQRFPHGLHIVEDKKYPQNP